ncbi:MAG: hypothetical protein AUI08_04255 [Gemmatimonadetes bacterium 13_2_20CM_2_65_7]|nr:MAG: hypothetical protein AUI08_04255 [Gemmatimonadetes bacterium 13_2_20CM_2_65_7]OLD03943.1 MAG: hypothetical protein AUI89_00585 [Gemmatimonadetes bacterium 13_1_40CM_3_65_8]
MKRFSLLLVGAGVLVGCGGGDGGGGGPPTITSVVVSGDSTVFLNGTRQLTATAKSGTTTVTNGVTFEWVSADTTRAVVSASGLVSGVRLGATDITARAVVNGTPTSVTSSAHPVRVRIAAIVVTPVSPAALNFVGDTQRFAGEPRDAQGVAVPGLTITWSSTDTALAIAASGLATAVRRTNAGGRNVRVRATTDGVTDSSVQILVRQIPVAVHLNPSTFPTLASLGQSVNAACVVLDSANDTIPNHSCGWSITGTDSGVVTFSTNNAPATRITGRKNGDANIQATAFASIFAPNFIQVRQAAARVVLHPTTLDTSQIVVNDSMRFIDSVFDANDSLLSAPPAAIVWSSTTSSATVDANGHVTAGSGAGATFIVATSGTSKDSALVVIVPAANARTLSGDVQPIFSLNCASCHDGVGTSLPGVQDLTAGHSFASIVNHAAIQSALKRVLPSVPDSSYLVHKIQGTNLLPPARGSGARMPLNGNPLSRGQINTIRNWILQGAKNN